MTPRPTAAPLRVHDRQRGCLVEEPVLGDRLLRWAYTTPAGQALAPLLFARAWVSRVLGWYADSPLSRGRIAPTVKALGIDLSECAMPPGGWRTYNAFFTRALRPGCRPFDPDPAVFCSPADCRLLVCADTGPATTFRVKNAEFRLAELLAEPTPDPALHAALTSATVLVARLCPADYHRFHFPCDGRVLRTWGVPGRYDSVNPLAMARGVCSLTGNRRQVTLLASELFGPVACVEVGAFGVGRIVQTHAGGPFRKLDEKGCFAFGGSTIVLALASARFRPDADLVARSRDGVETLVRAGERLGCAVPAGA